MIHLHTICIDHLYLYFQQLQNTEVECSYVLGQDIDRFSASLSIASGSGKLTSQDRPSNNQPLLSFQCCEGRVRATTKVVDNDQVVTAASEEDGNHILGHQVSLCGIFDPQTNFRRCNMLNPSVLDGMWRKVGLRGEDLCV